jgi:hypothetical protein
MSVWSPLEAADAEQVDFRARVVELVDTQVSEACVERHGSSSLPSGTILIDNELWNGHILMSPGELLALLAKIYSSRRVGAKKLARLGY